MLVFPKLPEVRSRDKGCYTEEVVMSICVMFGEDCIAIYVIIGYWNQVSLGVVKSINGLSEVVVTRVETVDIFGNAWIGVFGRT